MAKIISTKRTMIPHLGVRGRGRAWLCVRAAPLADFPTAAHAHEHLVGPRALRHSLEQLLRLRQPAVGRAQPPTRLLDRDALPERTSSTVVAAGAPERFQSKRGQRD